MLDNFEKVPGVSNQEASKEKEISKDLSATMTEVLEADSSADNRSVEQAAAIAASEKQSLGKTREEIKEIGGQEKGEDKEKIRELTALKLNEIKEKIKAWSEKEKEVKHGLGGILKGIGKALGSEKLVEEKRAKSFGVLKNAITLFNSGKEVDMFSVLDSVKKYVDIDVDLADLPEKSNKNYSVGTSAYTRAMGSK
jgi:hypothetical protein